MTRFTGKLQQNSLEEAYTMPIHLLWQPYVATFLTLFIYGFSCFQNPPNGKDATDYSCLMTSTAADCLLGDPPVTHGGLCTHPMQPGLAAAGGLQGTGGRMATPSLILNIRFKH